MRSAGYANVINWLSEIWSSFDEEIIKRSFDSCGITSTGNLNFALNQIIEDRVAVNEYIVSDSDNGSESEIDLSEEEDLIQIVVGQTFLIVICL